MRKSILDASDLEIEMLRALVKAGDERGQRVMIDGDDPAPDCVELRDFTYDPCQLFSLAIIHIRREVPLLTIDRDYRRDFLVSFVNCLPIPDFTEESGEHYTESYMSSYMAVEVDGNWHNDPVQARKDKKKDRMLQKAGETIFRFTRQDVAENSLARARETLRVLWNEHLENIVHVWQDNMLASILRCNAAGLCLNFSKTN